MGLCVGQLQRLSALLGGLISLPAGSDGETIAYKCSQNGHSESRPSHLCHRYVQYLLLLLLTSDNNTNIPNVYGEKHNRSTAKCVTPRCYGRIVSAWLRRPGASSFVPAVPVC